MDNWIQLIVSFLGGGSLIGILNFILNRQKQSSEEYITLLEKYKEDNDQLRKHERENRKQLEELKEIVGELRNKLLLMESAHYDLPLPQWLKDNNGVMLAFNTAYEDLFIIPNNMNPADYIGHTDIEFWGEEIGNEYRSNDIKVERSRKPTHVVETVKNVYGDDELWEFFKYPRYAGRTLIGIGGIAIKKIKIIDE